MTNAADVILVEQPHPEITLLRLNRPEHMNSLDESLIERSYQIFAELSADETQRVVIITGVGKAFCAGLDIKASVRWRSKPRSVVERFGRQELFAGITQCIRKLRQPVIAAVNGAAAGAGLGLALAADIRVASLSAQFMVAAIKMGITAGECGISYALPRLIGAARAFEVMLTGRSIDAAEAERIGLVSRLAEADQLVPAALEIAQMILANSPFGVAQTKKIMWANLDAPSFEAALDLENRAQLVSVYSDDFVEATRAFVEKRRPIFNGR